MKPALFYAALTIMLHSANVSAQQLQKPAEPLELRNFQSFTAPSAPVIPEQLPQNQIQQPRVDDNAQDLLRKSYEANPISQGIINQYGQGTAQQVVQQPSLTVQKQLEPDPRRIAYNKLIEDRFNQIAKAFGGVKHLAKNGALETARRKAAADVASYYGPPPEIERPLNELERVQLEHAKLALEETKLALEAAKVKAQKEAMTRDSQPRDKSEANNVTRENLEQSRPEGTGSGFFITDDGYLITNQHVAGSGATVRILTASGIIPAKVIKVDELNDLTLLKAEGKFAELPVVLSRKVQLGATVATVGFPNIGLQGFSPKLAKGEIASLAGIQDDARHFQISVPVQPGNSGGALVDEHGNVIGVVVAKLSQKAALATSGSLAENVNYAIKSSYLLSFLESVPEVAAKLKEPNTTQRDFETTIKDVEQAAVLVLVY
jgi:S1-C subfamily serine protease